MTRSFAIEAQHTMLTLAINIVRHRRRKRGMIGRINALLIQLTSWRPS